MSWSRGLNQVRQTGLRLDAPSAGDAPDGGADLETSDFCTFIVPARLAEP
jgi:hypothetical protein